MKFFIRRRGWQRLFVVCSILNVLFSNGFQTETIIFHNGVSILLRNGRYSFNLRQSKSSDVNFSSPKIESELSNGTTPPRFKKHGNRKLKYKNKKLQKHNRRERPKEEKQDSSSKLDASNDMVDNKIQVSIPDDKNIDHMAYLRSLDNHPSLLLNADYQPMSHLPLSLYPWQEAIKAIFSGKVTVVDVYPNVYIRAANIKMPLPSVIALNDYAPHARGQKPAFSRKHVYLRDRYRCQYCGKMFKALDLTLDHVKPRCLGGRLCWENAVSCCNNCNRKKGALELHELESVGMQLLREPKAPSSIELAQLAGQLLPKKVHPTWLPYLPFMKENISPVEKDANEVGAILNSFEE